MKTLPRSLLFPFAFVSLAAALILPSRVSAQITVTTVADEHDTPAGAQVSLREALRDSPNGGQITFDAALNGKVLVLTSGVMAVTGKTLTISAPGGVVIEARGKSRIFSVAAGAGLNLSGLTLQGGKATADGGAILNAGTLTLTDCVLRDNRAANGAAGANGVPHAPRGTTGGPGGTSGHGGAVSSTGSLTALRCRFIGNAAGGGGAGGAGGNAEFHPLSQGGPTDDGDGGAGGAGGNGGAIVSTGPLQLTECIFEANQSGTGGTGGNSGGFPGPALALSGNGGAGGNGGAVHQTGDMTVERCSFFENVCPPAGHPGSQGDPRLRGIAGVGASGAAVYWNTGTGTLTNCTMAANSTGEGRVFSPEFGGAIAAGAGTLLRLVHCTVYGNSAVRFLNDDPSSLQLTGFAPSSAAGIVAVAPVQCQNCILTRNLVIDSEINFSPDTQRTVIPFGPLGGTPGGNAQLNLLALTTGPLPVLRPRAASPAINAGALITGPPSTDQRGLPRAAGVPDLGAVEVQPSETASREPQSITFSLPDSIESSSLALQAFASSGLPVSFEVVSGPATLSNKTLSFTGGGFVAVRASQAGDETTAPALPVVRVIKTPLDSILFTPADSYIVFPPIPTIITLPLTTTAGLLITWSFAGSQLAGTSLNGTQLVARGPGTVQIRAQSSGNAEYAPVDSTWTLTFVQGAVWWETPAAPAGGPAWFTLVEGSPHGLTMTARIPAAHTGPAPVPSLPGGIIATPSVITAGDTSVQCLLTLPANPLLTNQTKTLTTGNPASADIPFFLANRANVPLDVFAPAGVLSGTSSSVDISSPGVPAGALYGPPPDLSQRTVSVSAVDFDNPAVTVPVTLDSATSGGGSFPVKHLQVTFPPMNRRARLTVTTDDGITGQSGPIQIHVFNPPPLTIEHDATGLRAVIASRPLDSGGVNISIETSTDLQTWTPAPAATTSVTPNSDGTTERVSVLLSAGAKSSFVRLKAKVP